jgi:hypothetical protein
MARTKNKSDAIPSSGNVFADLGYVGRFVFSASITRAIA